MILDYVSRLHGRPSSRNPCGTVATAVHPVTPLESGAPPLAFGYWIWRFGPGAWRVLNSVAIRMLRIMTHFHRKAEEQRLDWHLQFWRQPGPGWTNCALARGFYTRLLTRDTAPATSMRRGRCGRDSVRWDDFLVAAWCEDWLSTCRGPAKVIDVMTPSRGPELRKEAPGRGR